MPNRFAFLIFFLLLFLFGGCGRGMETPSGLVKWVEAPANGLHQFVDKGDVRFDLQYQPPAYIAANENAKPSMSRAFLEERLAKLGDLYYFRLSLIAKNGTDILMQGIQEEAEYYQRVNYYSADFQQDIQLVQGSDTLPCIMYQFENTYGATPYVRMVLAFSGKNRNTSDEHVTVLINERIFENGFLRFEFQADRLASVPTLKTE